MRWVQLILAGIALGLLSEAARAGIVLDGTFFVGSAPNTSQTWTNLPFPVSTSLNVSAPSGYSNNTVNMYLNGAQTVMSFDMQHRQVSNDRLSGFAANQILFTATANEPYELTGYYNVDQLSYFGFAEADVSFAEKTATSSFGGNPPNINLFTDNQGATFFSPNINLTIPGAGGNANTLTGSSTGQLIAGHQYLLSFQCYVQGFSNDSAAQAIGNITLRIGTVPEPAALLLVGVLSGSMLGLWRSRRK